MPGVLAVYTGADLKADNVGPLPDGTGLKRADGKQIYGFAHANDEFAFMLIDGGRPYDKDVKKWTFNDAASVSGLEKWVALAKEFSD